MVRQNRIDWKALLVILVVTYGFAISALAAGHGRHAELHPIAEAWTPINFGLELRLLVFIWMLLIALVVLTLIWLFPTRKTAAFLLLPYLAWLVFAAYLNLGTWLLNG